MRNRPLPDSSRFLIHLGAPVLLAPRPCWRGGGRPPCGFPCAIRSTGSASPSAVRQAWTNRGSEDRADEEPRTTRKRTRATFLPGVLDQSGLGGAKLAELDSQLRRSVLLRLDQLDLLTHRCRRSGGQLARLGNGWSTSDHADDREFARLGDRNAVGLLLGRFFLGARRLAGKGHGARDGDPADRNAVGFGDLTNHVAARDVAGEHARPRRPGRSGRAAHRRSANAPSRRGSQSNPEPRPGSAWRSTGATRSPERPRGSRPRPR